MVRVGAPLLAARSAHTHTHTLSHTNTALARTPQKLYEVYIEPGVTGRKLPAITVHCVKGYARQGRNVTCAEATGGWVRPFPSSPTLGYYTIAFA